MLRFILILLVFPTAAMAQNISLHWGKVMEITAADRERLESNFEIEIPEMSGPLFFEFLEGDGRVRDFSAYLNGKKLDVDLDGKRLTPATTNTGVNMLRVKFRGATGSKVSARLTDLSAYAPVLGPDLIKNTKKLTDYEKTFSVPASGEYILVAEPKSKHARLSLRSILLNGKRVFHDDCFLDLLFGHRQSGRLTAKIVALSGQNKIKVRLYTDEELTLTVLGDRIANVSPAKVTFDGLSSTGLNPLPSTTTIKISGATLNTQPEFTTILVNNKSVEGSAVHISANSITVDSMLRRGLNRITLVSEDTSGKSFTHEALYWAGDRTLRVRTIRQNGEPFLSGTLEVEPISFASVRVSAPIVNGVATFQNLPDGPAIFMARGPTGEIGTIPANIYQNEEITLVVGSTTKLVLPQTSAAKKSTGDSAVSKTSSVPLGKTPLNITITPNASMHTWVVNSSLTAVRETNVLYNNFELSIPVPPGALSVYIKARIRAERPEGPTEYPHVAGAVMWAYAKGTDDTWASAGDSAYYDAGFTPEMYYGVAIPAGATEITVYGSLAYYDYEKPVTITLEELNATGMVIPFFTLVDSTAATDGTNSLEELGGISLDGDIDNDLYDDRTFFGIISQIYYAQDDRVTDVSLRMRGPTGEVAIARLTTEGREALNKQKNGFVPFYSIRDRSHSGHIFEVTKDEAAKIRHLTEIAEDSQEGPINSNQIQVFLVAKTQLGQELTMPYENRWHKNRFPLFIYYTGGNRFGEKDENVGGDWWGRPRVIERINRISSFWNQNHPKERRITINDFSNMHGGIFKPHSLHKEGRSVDVRFDTFELGDTLDFDDPGPKAAKDLADFINGLAPVDRDSIANIFVTYKPGNEFDKTLTANLSRERRKLVSIWKEHKSHFHIEFKAREGDIPAYLYSTAP